MMTDEASLMSQLFPKTAIRSNADFPLTVYSASQMFLLIICFYLPIHQIQQSEVKFSMNSKRIKLLSTFDLILSSVNLIYAILL